MAGKSDSFESDILKLIFNGTNIANVADNTATSPLTNLYIALHTADPTDTGTQSSSEATYTGYARVAVARTTGGWTISGTTQVTNAVTITFGACTAGTNTITNFSVGVASTGATKILYTGALSSSLAVSSGVTPQFAAGSMIITED